MQQAYNGTVIGHNCNNWMTEDNYDFNSVWRPVQMSNVYPDQSEWWAMVCTIFSYPCVIFLQNKRFKNYPTIFIKLCRSYLQRLLTQVPAINFDREVACRDETCRRLRGTRPTGGISCRDNREKKLKTTWVKFLAGLAPWLLQALATFVGRWDIAALWMLSLALSSPPRFVSMHQPKGLWPRLTVQL